MDSNLFMSLYRCSSAMRSAANRVTPNYEQIFRAMLVAWAAENGFEPDLSKLAHDDKALYERLVAK